jgi:hypothetical protein
MKSTRTFFRRRSDVRTIRPAKEKADMEVLSAWDELAQEQKSSVLAFVRAQACDAVARLDAGTFDTYRPDLPHLYYVHVLEPLLARCSGASCTLSGPRDPRYATFTLTFLEELGNRMARVCGYSRAASVHGSR